MAAARSPSSAAGGDLRWSLVPGPARSFAPASSRHGSPGRGTPCPAPRRPAGGRGGPCRPRGAVVVPVGPGGGRGGPCRPRGARGWALLGRMGPVGLANKRPELWGDAGGRASAFQHIHTKWQSVQNIPSSMQGSSFFCWFFFSPPWPTLSPVLKRCRRHRTSAA